jgi:hypothetical protein
MRFLLICGVLLAAVSCGPRKTVNLHFSSLPNTNQGRALPLHVVPVDAALASKLDGMTAEEWFISDDVQTLTGIQKRVLRGAQNEVVRVERLNEKNDFLVIVDFAEIDDPDQQKLLIGDSHYKAKDVYVIVERDRVRIVSKSVYEDYLRTF